MGQVYQATDTNLDRQVAIKVLPDAFSSDPDRLTRFEREAKVLASLNHPNIGAIYGLEKSGDTRALVLELVEGPTLADRIDVDLGPPFSVGRPHALFEDQYERDLSGAQGLPFYDVMADGERFAMVQAMEESNDQEAFAGLIVVSNWFEKLKRLVPIE